MNEKNKKSEILDALKEAQAKIKELQSNKIDLKNEIETKEKTQKVENVRVKGLDNLDEVSNIIQENLKYFTRKVEKFREIDEAISIQETRLNELFQIEKELMQLGVVKDAQESAILRGKEQLNELQSGIMKAEEEYNRLKKEFNMEFEKHKARIESEYKYNFERKKTLDYDELEDTLKEQEIIFTKNWERKIEEVTKREEFMEELEAQVAYLQDKLESAKEEGKKEAGKEYGYQKATLSKDFENRINLLELENKNLVEGIKNKDDMIIKLNDTITNLYDKIENITSNVIDGANARNYATNLENALKEKNIK